MKKPIFILPFDHRSTFAKKLLKYDYPPKPYEALVVTEMKRVVFDALLEAREKQPEIAEHMAILIDLEFGGDIIKRAKKLGIPYAISTEKSGQKIFTFEYGDQFGDVLLKHLPTYAKALVRYNPANKEDNRVQLSRLKQLSDFCKSHQIGFMFELLVEGDGLQRDLMLESMKEVIAEGIEPTLWKLEGLNNADNWEAFQKITKADIIVLGRGESREAVDRWIAAAAQSGIADGFAIGRTIFFRALEDFRDKKISREEAIQQIAKNYLAFINLWQQNTAS